MTALLGKALKPIPVNETLLDYLQPQKRLQFIKQWRSAAANNPPHRRCPIHTGGLFT